MSRVGRAEMAATTVQIGSARRHLHATSADDLQEHFMSDTPSEPVISTPDGLPGFDQVRCWHLERDSPDAVFALLRATERPDVGLLVTEPWDLAPGYAPDLPEPELALLGVKEPAEIALLVVAGVDVAKRRAWLNLAAPIVVHVASGRARQVILDRQGWPVRHLVALGA
jgi:flagellar assembly factor FliW